MTDKSFPLETENPNVPEDVFLVYENTVVTTIYINRKGEIVKIGSRKSDFPFPTTISQMCRLTGATEKDLESRFNQWKEKQKCKEE